MHAAQIEFFDGDLDRRDTRRLDVGIVMATLLTLAAVIADLASGGRPDPPTLRAAATTLDGALAIPYRRRATLGERQYRR